MALSGCAEGTDCPLPGENMQSWQEKVIAELRKGQPPRWPPFCAGMHQDGVSDEITVAERCQDRWEGYRVFACTPARPTDPPNFDTCPVVGRGKVRWAFPTPGYVPTAACTTPPPIPPTPIPAPVPTPTPGACPPPVPGPLSRWGVKIHIRGVNWTTLDSTPLVGPDAVFCKAIGYTDSRRYCPPRTEGTPEAIVRACNEQVVGTEKDSQGRLVYPRWYWNYGELPDGVTHDDNPYHLLVRPTMEGRATVCGQNGVCDGVSLP